MSDFDKLCEHFGLMKTVKRQRYPKQIQMSEEFIEALKKEYYQQTIQEDNEKPVRNRPQKFLKALQFHVADLEKNKAAELEALRNMMDEAKKSDYQNKNAATNKVTYAKPSKNKDSDQEKTRQMIDRAKRARKKLNKENTEPYIATVKGEPQQGNQKVSQKAEGKRRKEVEKENMEPLQD